MDQTPEQLAAEKAYRYWERIGIMCDDGKPTKAQMATALGESERAIIELTPLSDDFLA